MRIKISSQPDAEALTQNHVRSQGAFTLAEVVIAMAITAFSLAGVIVGYVLAAQRAEWSAYSLAAQALATQRLEQTRAAKWDPRSNTNGVTGVIVDELVIGKFPTVSTNILDIPISRTNYVYATNYTSITDIPNAGSPL